MTIQDTTIGVGLIGYGIAGKIFHAPFLTRTTGLRLSHVVSSNPAKVHADLPDVVVYASPDEAFTDPAVELVVIATPNDSHFDLSRRALAAGKHVVVDKPFTIKLAEAVELLNLAKATERLLCVYQNRRFDSDFLTVRKLIDDDVIGDVLHFESHFDRCRPEVKMRWREMDVVGAGLWYDIGPHLIDQAIQLFGRPVGVYVDMEAQRDGAVVDDYVHTVLRYPRMRVILHIAAFVTGESPRFIVHGTSSSYVKYGLDPQEEAIRTGQTPISPTWGHDARDGTLYTRNGDTLMSATQPTIPGNYGAYYESIRDALLGSAPAPTTPTDMIAVMAILEAGFESAKARREVLVTEMIVESRTAS